jgi:hypothetical protein
LGCIYALSADNDAVTVGTGYHTIVAGGTCGIVDNGGLVVDALHGESHTVYVESIVATSYNNGGTVTPNPVPPPYQSSDPIANLIQTPSAPGACTGAPTIYAPAAGQIVAVPSGVYACGLTLSPTGGTVNLSGLYTIGGSGITISGSGSVIGDQTNGVTLYVSDNGSTSLTSVSIDADANADASPPNYGVTVQLQAPSDASNGIPGVVLFQDSNDSKPASITLAGFPPPDTTDARSHLWGVLYTPAATLTLTGISYDGYGGSGSNTDECSDQPRLTTVVANKLVLDQNLNFSVNDCVWPPVPVSTPVPALTQSAVLVQ